MSDLVLGIQIKADGSQFDGQIKLSKEELAAFRREIASGSAATDASTAAAVRHRQGLQAWQRRTQALRTHQQGLTRDLIGFKSALAGIGFVAAVRDASNFAMQLEGLEAGLTLASGSSAEAARQFQFVRDTADNLGLVFRGLLPEFVKISASAKGTSLAGEGVAEIFTAISEAAAVWQLSGDQVAGTLNAITQIMGKGTVQAEELRGQLGDRLYGAFLLAAQATGHTLQEFNKLLEQGKVISEEFLPQFAAELHRSVEGGLEAAANTTRAEVNRMKNAWAELQLQFAEGDFMEGYKESAEELASLFTALAGNDGIKEFGAAVGQLSVFVVEHLDLIAALTAAYVSGKVSAAVFGAALTALNFRPVQLGLTALVSLLGVDLPRAAKAAQLALLGLSRFMLANPATLVATAVAALVAGYILLGDETDNTAAAQSDLADQLARIKSLMDDINGASDERRDNLIQERDALIELTRAQLEQRRVEVEAEIARREAARNANGIVPDRLVGEFGPTFQNNEALANLRDELTSIDETLGSLQAQADLIPEIQVTVRPRMVLEPEDEAFNKLRDAYDDLLASLDPVAAANQEFNAGVIILDEALRAGLVSLERYKELMQQLAVKIYPNFADLLAEANEETREEIRLAGLSQEERAAEVILRDWINRAAKDNIDLTDQQIAQLRVLAVEQARGTAAAEERAEREREAAEAIIKIWQNATENVQRSIADMIDEMLSGNLDSIGDFWNSFVTAGRRAIAETAAALLFTGQLGDEAGAGLAGLFGQNGSMLGELGSLFGSLRQSIDNFGTSLGFGLASAANIASGPEDAEGDGGGGDDGAPESDGKQTFSSFLKNMVEGAVVSSIVANIFGKGELESQIGGAAGQVIGQMIGGPVGAAIGRILGSIGGALIAKSPHASVDIVGEGLNVDVTDPLKRGKGDIASIKTLGASVASLFESLGALGNGYFEGNLGSLGHRKEKYFFDPTGQGGRGGTRWDYDTPEEAILQMIKNAFFTESAKGFSSTFSTIARTSSAGTPDELFQDFQFGSLYDELIAIDPAISEVETAIQSLNKQFDAAIRQASKLELSEQALIDAREKLLAHMRSEFNDDIEIALLEFTEPLKAALLQQKEEQEARLREAYALGADLNRVRELNAREREKMIDEFSTSINSVFRQLDESIENFIAEIRGGKSSHFAADVVLQNATTRFNELLVAANDNDESALRNIVGAADNMKEAIFAVYGQSAIAYQLQENLIAQLESLKGLSPEVDVEQTASEVPVATLTNDIMLQVDRNIMTAAERAEQQREDMKDLLEEIADNTRARDNQNLPASGAGGGGSGGKFDDIARRHRA